MKRIGLACVLLALWLSGPPARALTEQGCDETFFDLVGTVPNNRGPVEASLPAPEVVDVEFREAAPQPTGGCGSVDLCEDTPYYNVVVRNLPTPTVLLSIGYARETYECLDGVWVSGRPVPGSPDLIEFRRVGRIGAEPGAGCIRGIDSDGFRTPKTEFVVPPSVLTP